MLSDLLQTIVGIAQYLWPFREVQHWERGAYMFFGRVFAVVGPGRWPVVPYFMDVIAVTTVPAIISTPLQTITLSDGHSTLTYSASALVRVIDVRAALVNIDSYEQTSQELLAAELAKELADADADRLTSDKRGRLITTIKNRISSETEKFGVVCEGLFFTNYAINLRTYRLLVDNATQTTTAGW
jgi:regulator of protease activity HflC (stomatin/prohibitin superfamily)